MLPSERADLFVEVTGEIVRFSSRWSPPVDGQYRPQQTVVLKELLSSDSGAPADPKDESIEPALQAAEDLNINDARPSTETGDKAATHDLKRPVVENLDGVVTFLLEQLLVYQKVDDVEISILSKDPNKPAGESRISHARR